MQAWRPLELRHLVGDHAIPEAGGCRMTEPDLCRLLALHPAHRPRLAAVLDRLEPVAGIPGPAQWRIRQVIAELQRTDPELVPLPWRLLALPPVPDHHRHLS